MTPTDRRAAQPMNGRGTPGREPASGGLLERCLVLVGCLLTATPCYAYLDPGTGSMVLQLLIASIAAGLLTFRRWWRTLRQFIADLLFRRRSGS